MKAFLCTLILILHVPIQDLLAQESDYSLYGTWQFIQEKSSNLATWRYRKPELVISDANGIVTIDHNWIERKRIALIDRYTFRPGGEAERSPVTSEIWTDNWFMGVLAKKHSERTVSGRWIVPGEALITVSDLTVSVSQGEATITTTREYRLEENGESLTLRETRSSRPTAIVLVFERRRPEEPR